MSKVGALLKAEREKRGLSLHEISMSLKISVKVLTAIEEGDRANLPAKTFQRGFIRSYAQYLKLDVPHVLELFSEEDEDKPSKDESNSDDGAEEKASGTAAIETAGALLQQKYFWGLGLALVLGAGIYLSLDLMHKYKQEAVVVPVEIPESLPEVEDFSAPLEADSVSEPIDPQSAETQVESGGPISSAPSLASTTSTTLKGVSLPTTTTSTTLLRASTTTSFRTTTTSTLRPTTTSTVRPTTSTLRPTTTTLRPTTTSTAPPVSASTESAMTRDQEVLIEGLKAVTLTYQLDGAPAITVKLQPGEIRALKASEKIVIRLSEGQSANITINGRYLGAAGTSGRPYSFTTPR